MKQLDQYQRTHRELVKLTRDGTLQWRQIDRHANGDLILQADCVIRQFETIWLRNGSPYTLLLVEKKETTIQHPLLGPEETETVELLILEEGELVARLNKNFLNWVELTWLAAAVQQNSGKSNKFFAMAG